MGENLTSREYYDQNAQNYIKAISFFIQDRCR